MAAVVMKMQMEMATDTEIVMLMGMEMEMGMETEIDAIFSIELQSMMHTTSPCGTGTFLDKRDLAQSWLLDEPCELGIEESMLIATKAEV